MAKKKKRPKKPLTGLAAALVKSGHLQEKKARDMGRVQRREDKALGKEGVAQREAERQAEADARKAAEAQSSREREGARQQTESDQRAIRTVEENMDPGASGRRRWFFVTRDQRVLFLDVSDEAGRLLGDGQAGIVEDPGPGAREHVVVRGERALVTLVGIDPGLVRFWNRGTA